MKTNDLFPLTGFTEDRRFAIHGDEFLFTFMENKLTEGKLAAVDIEDDMIRGYTHAGNQIAIACENELQIDGYRRLRTYCVFKARDRLDGKATEFNKIVFTGGMLNQLYRRHSLNIDPRNSKNTQIGVKIQSDTLSYKLKLNEEDVQISIWSSVSVSYSWSEGTRIKNTDVNLAIVFTEKKPLSYAIKCYQHICDCVRFMMNRENIGFDSISVLSVGDEQEFPEQDRFDVYFRDDYDYTEKDGHRCITFEDLGESFVNLYLLFAMSTSSKMKYSLGFYPENDRAVYKINNSIIRSICAALEFEAGEEPRLKPENNPELKELIESVKKCIREYRKTHTGLSESTYGSINGSIDFWAFSAKDKIQMLWDIHKVPMDVLTRQLQQNYKIDISAFTKYRNSITHGAELRATEQVAAMAYALRGLVYCCVLKRIGLSEEAITDLCNYQINE